MNALVCVCVLQKRGLEQEKQEEAEEFKEPELAGGTVELQAGEDITKHATLSSSCSAQDLSSLTDGSTQTFWQCTQEPEMCPHFDLRFDRARSIRAVHVYFDALQDDYAHAPVSLSLASVGAGDDLDEEVCVRASEA